MQEIFEKNKDISNLSNFRTKAKSKYYYEIKSFDDLSNLNKIFKFAQDNNFEIIFIGGGTNMLFAFALFNGIIIKNSLKGWSYDENTGILEANSGTIISNISKNLKNDYNQNTWERFIGLPGTIGGAVCGNAGCFGLEAENNFKEAKVLNIKTGQLEIFNKENMQFSYRNSLLKNSRDYFLVSAKFDLLEKKEKYSNQVDIFNFRKNNQPRGFTCGSFFKNPSKDFPAGKLIDEVGLKGYELNGAFFSSKHANFLMNDGTATYKDLIYLIEIAQKKVKNKFNLDLIPEVRIIYNLK